MRLSKEGCHKISIARCFGLNRTTLYRWDKMEKTPSLTALQHQIIAVYERSEFTYGTRRIQAELRLQGIIIARSKVRKEMNLLQLKPRYPKPRFYRKSQGVCVGNTLNQVFYTKQINVIWTGDISYIPTKQGWLYLAVVLDLCSRKVVGWACSDTPDTDLTERALL